MNKKLKIVFFSIIFIAILLIMTSNVKATTIIETTNTEDNYDSIETGTYVVGITKFQPEVVISATRVLNAANNYYNSDLKESNLSIYYFAAGDWYSIDEDNNYIPVEDSAITEKLNKKEIYYVNNEEKIVDIEYSVPTDYTLSFETNDSSRNNEVKHENGKLLIPATLKTVKVTATRGDTSRVLDEYTRTDGEFVSSTTIVKTLEELEAAIEAQKTPIRLGADIKGIDETIIISYPVELDGNGHKLQFNELTRDSSGSASGLVIAGDNSIVRNLTVELTQKDGWDGNYAIQVFDAKEVILDEVTATGADGAILVNGSDVTLEGNVNVSGNEFGGIEVSKGRNISENGKLTVNGTITMDDEEMSKPVIWVEKDQGTVEKTPEGYVYTTETNDKNQTYYYSDEKFITIDEVHSIDELKEALTKQYVTTIKLCAPTADDSYKTSEIVDINKEGVTIIKEAENAKIEGQLKITASNVTLDGVVLTSNSGHDGVALTIMSGADNIKINKGEYTDTDKSVQGNGAIEFLGAVKNVSVIGATLKGGIHLENYVGSVEDLLNNIKENKITLEDSGAEHAAIIIKTDIDDMANTALKLSENNTFDIQRQGDISVLVHPTDSWDIRASVRPRGEAKELTFEENSNVTLGEGNYIIPELKEGTTVIGNENSTVKGQVAIANNVTIKGGTWTIGDDEESKKKQGEGVLRATVGKTTNITVRDTTLYGGIYIDDYIGTAEDLAKNVTGNTIYLELANGEIVGINIRTNVTKDVGNLVLRLSEANTFEFVNNTNYEVLIQKIDWTKRAYIKNNGEASFEENANVTLGERTYIIPELKEGTTVKGNKDSIVVGQVKVANNVSIDGGVWRTGPENESEEAKGKQGEGVLRATAGETTNITVKNATLYGGIYLDDYIGTAEDLAKNVTGNTIHLESADGNLVAINIRTDVTKNVGNLVLRLSEANTFEFANNTNYEVLIQKIDWTPKAYIKNNGEASFEANSNVTLGERTYIIPELKEGTTVKGNENSIVVGQVKVANNVTIDGGVWMAVPEEGDKRKQGEGTLRLEGEASKITVKNATLYGGIHVLDYTGTADNLEENVVITGNTIYLEPEGTDAELTAILILKKAKSVEEPIKAKLQEIANKISEENTFKLTNNKNYKVLIQIDKEDETPWETLASVTGENE